MKMKKFGLYTIFLILLVTNLVDSGLSGAQEDLSPIIDKLNSLEKDIYFSAARKVSNQHQ